MNEKNNKSSKILVMGLDNSGKTTIVLNLIGKTNLLDYISIKPTLGADIVQHEINDSSYSIWDLGGQEVYREEYLENFKEYIKEASKIVYVIDIQDNQRYDLALDYFKNIMVKVDNLGDIIEITVFLHKNDPHLENSRPDINEQTIEHLINEIKKLIPDKIYYEIFTSTIYTVFDKSLKK